MILLVQAVTVGTQATTRLTQSLHLGGLIPILILVDLSAVILIYKLLRLIADIFDQYGGLRPAKCI